MYHLGNIFLYNNNTKSKENYHNKLKQQGFFVFDTDNLHKLTLYNKEITPDVLLLDFEHKTPINFITSIERQFGHANTPLVVISDAPKALIFHPAISHYLSHIDDQKKLQDIIESYSIGNKKHHVLYINLKPYEKDIFTKSITEKGYSLFEVHNIRSASYYLKKNTPSIICINFLPALSKSRKLFSHHKTFYVENTQNIEEIEQFLH